jgi:4-amino-4-deoxy-L-arabinose transferase-like glycosyltransferase
MARWIRDHRLLFCAGLAALLYLPGLGRPPLWEPDEGRYAEVAREMLVGHDYVTPHNDFVRYFEKPPLVYWATAASLRIFGHNEFAVRFQAAIASVGQIAVTNALAEMMFGAAAGLLAALALALSPLFFGFARFATPDPALAFFLAAAMGCFYAAARTSQFRGGSSRAWMLAAAVMLAFGTLAKGPVAVLLGGTIALAWLVVEGRARDALSIPWFRCTAAYAAITAPWFIIVSERNPGFLRFFILHEHLQRYIESTEHGWGPWFFIPIIFAGTWPWLYFAPLALSEYVPGFLSAARVSALASLPSANIGGDAGRTSACSEAGFQPVFQGELAPSIGRCALRDEGRIHSESQQRRSAVHFLLIWFGVIFVFFSIPRSKLGEYILPALPAVAILAGRGLIRLSEIPLTHRRRLLIIFLAINTVVASSVTMAVFAAKRGGLISILAGNVLVIAAALVGSAIAAFLCSSPRRPIAGVVLPLVIGVLLAMAVAIDARGKIAPMVSCRRLATAIAPFAHQGCRLASYRHFEQALPFYTGVKETLVNYRGELEPFGPINDRQGAIFATAPQLRKIWAGGQCIVLVVNRLDVPTVAKLLSPMPRLIGCEGKKVALYNGPLDKSPQSAAECGNGEVRKP